MKFLVIFLFQSLSGLTLGLNNSPSSSKTVPAMFQSLSGLTLGLNTKMLLVVLALMAGFQSLSGLTLGLNGAAQTIDLTIDGFNPFQG